MFAHLPRLKRCAEYFSFSGVDKAFSPRHKFDKNLDDNSISFAQFLS